MYAKGKKKPPPHTAKGAAVVLLATQMPEIEKI
jgi:hypothetical protein